MTKYQSKYIQISIRLTQWYILSSVFHYLLHSEASFMHVAEVEHGLRIVLLF